MTQVMGFAFSRLVWGLLQSDSDKREHDTFFEQVCRAIKLACRGLFCDRHSSS